MISVCQIKFVLFVRFVFKHQEQRIREWDPCAKKYSCYSSYSCSKNLVWKKSRVQSAEGKIRESEIRVLKNIRVIRVIRVQKKLVFKKSRVQSAEGKIRESEIRVPKTSRKKAPCTKKIRVIRAIRVQKISCSKNLVPIMFPIPSAIDSPSKCHR